MQGDKSLPLPVKIEIEELADRLLVAAYGAPEESDEVRGPEQWAKDVIPLAFKIAEAFVIERYRRRAT